MDSTDLSQFADEAQPQSYTNPNTLLKKYDIPLNHLDFPYVEKCTNAKELERILHVLQSGEEGYYPDLLKKTEERLAEIKPTSKFLRKTTPVLDIKYLDKDLKEELKESVEIWLKDVGDQDQELQGHKNSSSFQELPQVRKSKEQQDLEERAKNQKRIKSTDYASWDKYDPDTEILKMDLETEKLKKQSEESNKSPTKVGKSVKFAEFPTSAEANYEATREKDKGNEYYRSGDYQAAILCYTNSIHFLPSATNYNNRAQAHIKLKKFKEAVDDCRAAIKYEPNNVKALLRLAQSYQELKVFSDAICYAERVVQLEPNNIVAQNLLNKLNQQIGGVASPKKKTRMKIVEFEKNQELTSRTSRKGNKTSSRKSILKKSSNNNNEMKKNQVLLPIPGPSTMPEPYYIVADNKDPELVKLQEFVINNKPQPLYMGNIDIDDDECPVIHNIRREKEEKTISNDSKEEICSKQEIISGSKEILQENNLNQSYQEIIDNKENIKNKQESNTTNILENTIKCNGIKNDSESKLIIKEINESNMSSTNKNDDYLKQEDKIEKSQDDHLNNNLLTNKSSIDYCNHINCAETNENQTNLSFDQINQLNLSFENLTISATYNKSTNEEVEVNQPGGGGEPHLDLNGNNESSTESLQDIHMPFSFLRAWNSVQRDETYAQHAEILRNLDERRLAEVIGFKLDGTMLADIVRTLYLHFTVAHEVERLHAMIINIATIPRFSISAMFLSKQDQSRTRSLFEFLEQHGMPISQEIIKQYL